MDAKTKTTAPLLKERYFLFSQVVLFFWYTDDVVYFDFILWNGYSINQFFLQGKRHGKLDRGSVPDSLDLLVWIPSSSNTTTTMADTCYTPVVRLPKSKNSSSSTQSISNCQQDLQVEPKDMIVSETLHFDGLAGAISEMDLQNLLQAYPPLE